MRLASSNPNNLPLEVAVVIEESAATVVKKRDDAPQGSAPSLIDRLTAIRERLFWVQAVWANTLSPDVAREADRYRELFRELSEQLRKLDPDAVDRLIAGHEALLLAEPTPPKPTIPSDAQRWFDLMCELRGQRRQAPMARPVGYVPDGLQSFV
jgi:hypothetical protein